MKLQIAGGTFIAKVALAVLLALPAFAYATLGESVSSAQTDKVQMKASLRVSPAAHFTVHEMTLPHGTVVREFVSPQGVVFAVSWRGPVKPDLRQLMGPWFDRYLESAPASRRAQSAVTVARPDLVMRSAGHMRAFSGHAYLPGFMPEGVTTTDLQPAAGDLP